MNNEGIFANRSGVVLRFLLTLLIVITVGTMAQVKSPADGALSGRVVMDSGGIIRMDSTRREIFLVFTGHEFADGGTRIRTVLKKHGIKGSFFFTGDFYRNPAFAGLIESLHADGHYLGGHSDRHLLYAPWTNRDSLLVTKKQFIEDLANNKRAMARFGITASRWFLPPFEWYNDTIAAWTREAGLTLLNFTPGTRSNVDYMIPGDPNYMSSADIERSILRYEKNRPGGLCGFLLLTHIGTDPRRADKFYDRLDGLIRELKRRGYLFRRFPSEGFLR